MLILDVVGQAGSKKNYCSNFKSYCWASTIQNPISHYIESIKRPQPQAYNTYRNSAEFESSVLRYAWAVHFIRMNRR